MVFHVIGICYLFIRDISFTISIIKFIFTQGKNVYVDKRGANRDNLS